MIEKVNPAHPDKVADRIAGAIVDLAYKKNDNPKVACEVLIGHGVCHIILETSETFTEEEIKPIVERISGNNKLDLVVVPQDKELARNQNKGIRCGDNGIFKGVPTNAEEKIMSIVAHYIYELIKADGKYILDKNYLIVCQSHTNSSLLYDVLRINFPKIKRITINPIGDWEGGTNVDTGATNRKLGSDMARAVTGGGLHGKDLSKADVSVNIYAHLKAQETGKEVNLSCAIGDEEVDGKPYSEIVEIARNYINHIGGFEKLAEWGLY